MKATQPGFTGPQPLAMGKRVWGLPRGARVAHAHTRGLVYVLLPDGSLHLLRNDGELPIPRTMYPALRHRYFGSADDDQITTSSVASSRRAEDEVK